MHLPLCLYFPPCSDFKYPGPSWWCSILPVWQGRELLTWISSKAPVAGPVGLGLQQSWPWCWSQGPYLPKAISLPSVFQCTLQFWPPTFIYSGIPLAVYSVPQKIDQVFHLCPGGHGLCSHLPYHHLPTDLVPFVYKCF